MKKGGTKLSPTEIQQFVAEYFEENNYSVVARNHDKSPCTIRTAVERYRLENPEEYNKIYQNYLQKSEQAFITKTTNVISRAVDKITEKMDTDEVSIAQIATTMGILYDKRQLSMGKSTQNTAVVIKMEGDLQDLAK